MKSRPTRQANCSQGPRALRIEWLEDRCVLDAAVTAEPASEEFPYHNDLYPLDVNNNGVTTPSDLLAVINAVRLLGVSELEVPPPEPVTAFIDTNGDNNLTASDVQRVIFGLQNPPELEISMLAPFTIDVTPQVTVRVTPRGNGTVPDGTVVWLDVDLNNDGDFNDPGELNHTQSTTYANESNFSLSTPLERRDEVYTVRLRARLQDSRAVPGASAPTPLVVDTLTSTALADYVNTPDSSYAWEVRKNELVTRPGVGVYTYYAIDMTSQTWRSEADVNLPVWRHWLELYVPTTVVSNTAMLLIDGGSNQNFDTPPSPVDEMAVAALSLGSIVANLKVVPNEPVIFTDEAFSRTEDAIIAYSFDKFLENTGQPGNDTWPVLVAMVKSAVRAMDTIETFADEVLSGASIEDFLVTGYSKRGWTTWLTAAIDDRVRGIIPGVFDNLNQGQQMVHHYGVYGFFSEAVQPYNQMQIFDRILTPEALPLSRIVDPYSYLANGRFDDMPKLVINSAGDEFFVTDSAQFYFDDIPGDQNYLLYIPNSGHGLDYDLGLDSQVLKSTITFADAVLNGRPLPQYSWTVGQDGSIRVETGTAPSQVRLWHVDNPTSRDFRDFFHNLSWSSEILAPAEPGVYVGNVDMPATGARAYFVQLTFPNNTQSPNEYLTSPYVFTTEVRVKSPLAWHDWPFETAFDLDGAPAATPAVAAPLDEQTKAAGLALSPANDVGLAIAIADEILEQTLEEAVETIAPASSAAPLAAPASSTASQPLQDSSMNDLWQDVLDSGDESDDALADFDLENLIA